MAQQQGSANEADRPEYRSYPEIVWEQFKQYPLSYYSLFGVGFLFIVALIAPLISMNVPFYLHVPKEVAPSPELVGTTFPWFFALFDTNIFEGGVDIFFNFLLFTIPLNVIIWLLYSRATSFEDKKHYKSVRGRFIGASLLVQTVGFIAVIMADIRQPYVDYVVLAQKDGVDAVWPLLKYSYRDVNLMAVGMEPSWEHLLGTDREGRDVFTRLLYGTRISLTIGVVAVAITASIGMFFGSIAGYFGGTVDMIVLRLIEVMSCFPVLFLILTLRGFIDDPSIFHIMAIIGLTYWVRIARLVRGEFLRLKSEDFVQAAQALGLKESRIIFRHVLPNSLGPILVAVTFLIAGAILIEATLSFLGVGPTTAPSWGQILMTGRETGQMSLILAPGFAIFVTVSLLNLVGDGIRDAVDPKLKK